MQSRKIYSSKEKIKKLLKFEVKMFEIENITEDQSDAIEKFKSIIDDELLPILRADKSLYYRFLKARDFNIRNAETLLRKHLADRKLYFDPVIAGYKPPERIFEFFPLGCIGFDKAGSAIIYIDIGRADFKGLAALYTFPELVHFVVHQLEETIRKMTEHNIRIGKTATQFFVILNFEKFSLFQATFKKGLEYIMNGLQLYQDNLPERVKAVYIINASFYFNLAYPIVKAALASALLNKIKIFGKADWREEFLEQIDADSWPAFLGGNLTDPDGDPWCPSFVTLGKKIPEELYAKKRNSIMNEKGVKKLIITRFSSSEIMLYVYEPNTRIEWEFETKTKDIGFGLYYKDSSRIDPKIEELIPKQRIDTILSAEAGVFKCNKVGTYIIVFDNSYSWIYSKELHYRIRLIKPNTIKAFT